MDKGPTTAYSSMQEFIIKHRVEKGCEFTHTSLGRPAGSFYVPSDEMDLFYEVYDAAFDKKEELHITEKHRHLGPLVVDLDFRFSAESGTIRRYSAEDLEQIVSVYGKEISDFVKLSSPTIDFYVLEKSKPVLANGIVKDGIHIQIPDISTKPSVQYVIRNHVLEQLKPVFEKIGCINPAEEVVDEAVIYKNNWLMYGSKKVNGEAYKMTRILRYRIDTGTLEEIESPYSQTELVSILSIRNKYEEKVNRPEKNDAVREFEKEQEHKLQNHQVNKNIMVEQRNHKQHRAENFETVEKMVDILSPERAQDYNSWIRLGWCLRNIDNRLVEKWDQFSKHSKKYQAGQCEKIWNNMRDGGLGIGTLHMWAKEDNLEKYKEIMHNDLKQLMYASSTGTHHDVAKVAYHLFKQDFVCASIKNRYWYEYRGHRWLYSDSGLGLRLKLSDDLWKEYHHAAIEYSHAAVSSADAQEQNRYGDLAKKMNEIALKLRTTSFKENVMKECSELFYIEKFEERLDANANLIGFENGVYDMELMEFRDGRPEDFITFTTGNDYVPFRENHHIVQRIYAYLCQVLPRVQVREYVLKLFASFINGAVKEQKFYIWTGSGSNSKSLLVELFEGSFGDYCCKFPITLLTQKRVASNAANSELARAKGKRFACLQEPSEDEKLNIGLMKELSGGDKILARAIYREPVEFKPMFKMVLCCNQLPHVPSDDGGTWRRIRVVEFTSKFVENPQTENEYPIDIELPQKMHAWRPYFISMLIEYYKRYMKEGNREPEEVLMCTNDYKNANDYMSCFIGQNVEKKEGSFLVLDEVYSDLRSWIKDDGVPIKTPSKPDLERYLSKALGRCVMHNHSKGFRGYKLKNKFGNDDDLIDM